MLIPITILHYVLIAIANLLPRYTIIDHIRVMLYQLSGVNIGIKTRIAGPLILDMSLRDITTKYINIGSGCYINYNCRISANKSHVSIGDSCMIGPNVSFETAGHHPELSHEEMDWYAKPIRVGNNVWIGANALILPGITIADNAIVAAGAVVAADVPENAVVGGVPAKMIRERKPASNVPP